MTNGIDGFRVIKAQPRTPWQKFTHLWRKIPDGAWEAIGTILVKLVGESVHGKILRLIIISMIAAATGAEFPEDSQK